MLRYTILNKLRSFLIVTLQGERDMIVMQHEFIVDMPKEDGSIGKNLGRAEKRVISSAAHVREEDDVLDDDGAGRSEGLHSHEQNCYAAPRNGSLQSRTAPLGSTARDQTLT